MNHLQEKKSKCWLGLSSFSQNHCEPLASPFMFLIKAFFFFFLSSNFRTANNRSIEWWWLCKGDVPFVRQQLTSWLSVFQRRSSMSCCEVSPRAIEMQNNRLWYFSNFSLRWSSTPPPLFYSCFVGLCVPKSFFFFFFQRMATLGQGPCHILICLMCWMCAFFFFFFLRFCKLYACRYI